jgi:hypothetical protein
MELMQATKSPEKVQLYGCVNDETDSFPVLCGLLFLHDYVGTGACCRT